MTDQNFNTYDFIVNEDDDIMLLIYARNSKPQKPFLEIDFANQQAFLYRTETDGITLNDIPEDIMDIFYEIDKILVCELSSETNDEDIK